MDKPILSVVIIAKNEEEMITACLKSVSWANEIVLVDSGSTDATPAIAKKYSARVIFADGKRIDYAKWRNVGLKTSRGDWLLYVDADERITPSLRQSIEKVMTESAFSAYEIRRINYFLGQEMHHGGGRPDYVKRLFRRRQLKSWEAKLHESPLFDGEMGRLEAPLLHFTHRDLVSMMNKTIRWTKIEADLLYQNGHPPVVWWRFFRMMASKFYERIIRQQAWRDGTVGWINAIFEVFDTFIIYARLWEMQQNKSKIINQKSK